MRVTTAERKHRSGYLIVFGLAVMGCSALLWISKTSSDQGPNDAAKSPTDYRVQPAGKT